MRTANRQVCECETNYWINFNFTSKVVTPVERHTSEGEGQSSYYTIALKSVMTDSSLYVTSRRKSTTLHLEFSGVTIVDNLSTLSFAAGPVRSDQMLIYISYLYYI